MECSFQKKLLCLFNIIIFFYRLPLFHFRFIYDEAGENERTNTRQMCLKEIEQVNIKRNKN